MPLPPTIERLEQAVRENLREEVEPSTQRKPRRTRPGRPGDDRRGLVGFPGTHVHVGLDAHDCNDGEDFAPHRTGLDHLSFAVRSLDELAAWAFAIARTSCRSPMSACRSMTADGPCSSRWRPMNYAHR